MIFPNGSVRQQVKEAPHKCLPVEQVRDGFLPLQEVDIVKETDQQHGGLQLIFSKYKVICQTIHICDHSSTKGKFDIIKFVNASVLK